MVTYIIKNVEKKGSIYWAEVWAETKNEAAGDSWIESVLMLRAALSYCADYVLAGQEQEKKPASPQFCGAGECCSCSQCQAAFEDRRAFRSELPTLTEVTEADIPGEYQRPPGFGADLSGNIVLGQD